MKSKEEIVRDWLPRYTGLRLDQFGEYILLTNFAAYVDQFATTDRTIIEYPTACHTLEFEPDRDRTRKPGG